MSRFEVKSPTAPDEVRPFPRGRLDLLKFDEVTVGRALFEPGWRWSTSVKPIAHTESCQASHVGFCARGRMHVRMDDGASKEIGPGDFFSIPPGHDAWVVGDEVCEMLDFGGYEDYAKRREPIQAPSQAPLPAE